MEDFIIYHSVPQENMPEYKTTNCHVLINSDKTQVVVYEFAKNGQMLVTHDDNLEIDPDTVFYCLAGEFLIMSEHHNEKLLIGDCFKTGLVSERIKVKAQEKGKILIVTTSSQDIGAQLNEDTGKMISELEKKDRYTVGHSKRVCEYALEIGMNMKNHNIDINSLMIAASLHDVGKIDIPDNILNKPAKLNDEEYLIIKQHPEASIKMITKFNLDPYVLRIIKEHHERLDGSGYPYGLKGKAISLEGRILMIADVFDAISSTRCYRKKYDLQHTLEIIKKEVDDQKFDPSVYQSLLECLSKKTIVVDVD